MHIKHEHGGLCRNNKCNGKARGVKRDTLKQTNERTSGGTYIIRQYMGRKTELSMKVTNSPLHTHKGPGAHNSTDSKSSISKNNRTVYT